MSWPCCQLSRTVGRRQRRKLRGRVWAWLSRGNIPSGRAGCPARTLKRGSHGPASPSLVDAVYPGSATKFEAHHAKPIEGIKAGLRAIYEPADHRSERLRTVLEMLQRERGRGLKITLQTRHA